MFGFTILNLPRNMKRMEDISRVYSRAELNSMSKEELIEIILKSQPHEELEIREQKKKKQKVESSQELDWSKYSQRHIALKFSYLGWEYHGLATSQSNVSLQEPSLFVEDCIFKALKRSKLIPENSTWNSCNYSRSGRTDKGVSAFGQVMAVTLRSNASSLQTGVISVGSSCITNPKNKEIDYVTTLNRLLPDDIKILAWTPVNASFSARFSTLNRTYKYLFVNDSSLNIQKMKQAGDKFIGLHDFRNFCKFDPHTTIWEREVKSFSIDKFESLASCNMEIFVVTVQGSSFLWHQIRCMMYVLFLVGAGLEEPQVIDSLLDLNVSPCKPIYELASEIPLILYDCQYEDLQFNISEAHMEKLKVHFLSYWEKHLIKSQVAQLFLNELSPNKLFIIPQNNTNNTTNNNALRIPLGTLHGKYISLLKREVELNYEERKSKNLLSKESSDAS